MFEVGAGASTHRTRWRWRRYSTRPPRSSTRSTSPTTRTRPLRWTPPLRARDFCAKIAARLSLASAEGFSLFVKIADKVFTRAV